MPKLPCWGDGVTQQPHVLEPLTSRWPASGHTGPQLRGPDNGNFQINLPRQWLSLLTQMAFPLSCASSSARAEMPCLWMILEVNRAAVMSWTLSRKGWGWEGGEEKKEVTPPGSGIRAVPMEQREKGWGCNRWRHRTADNKWECKIPCKLQTDEMPKPKGHKRHKTASGN